jgi:antitoxin component of RelBE/YafQ-DinJ toxin-antitoxin module
MLHIRVDDDIKEQTTQTLAAMEESRAKMAKRRARFASADELFSDLEKNSSK